MEKRMTNAGYKEIEKAKANGECYKQQNSRHDVKMSPDLNKALKKNRKAAENFAKLVPSYQKKYRDWIVSAKRQKTKNKRINEEIKLLEKGEKLGMG